MSNLLVAYRHLHRQRCNTVRTMYDEVLWSLITQIGQS
ncbi:Uncharacterised protein [Segatella copri]|nr:Uncharacterised protein [Segatella copri]